MFIAPNVPHMSLRTERYVGLRPNGYKHPAPTEQSSLGLSGKQSSRDCSTQLTYKEILRTRSSRSAT